MSRLVSRKKSKFQSARAAWVNIRNSGIPESRIISAQHTATKWQWKIRSKGERKSR